MLKPCCYRAEAMKQICRLSMYWAIPSNISIQEAPFLFLDIISKGNQYQPHEGSLKIIKLLQTGRTQILVMTLKMMSLLLSRKPMRLDESSIKRRLTEASSLPLTT